MKIISDKEIGNRILFENPWWRTGETDPVYKGMKPRLYLDSFLELISKKEPTRAVVLMGPRRVGKSVMIHHAIQQLIQGGMDRNKICYISLDAPIYTGCGLEQLVKFYASATNRPLDGAVIFFDEVQYLRNWETHLKKLVEDFPATKFIASGSAAAALRLKSLESGAGRFTDFRLPPLTFQEFLHLLGNESAVRSSAGKPNEFEAVEIRELNAHFINYLNYGGYPEALFSKDIQADPQRFIRSDIIDKVLLRDLPQLYGIEDIQELNRLFMMLAYNSGDEVSLENLSQGSGVAKNTIKRYLEYLEAAFLIVVLDRIDQSGKMFKRANYFKAYLTNPSMRCALFGPVSEGHEAIGSMAETAVITQWLHSLASDRIYYARWHKVEKGEVDMVYHNGERVLWCTEIKWSDRYFERPNDLKSLIQFCAKNKLTEARATTKEKGGSIVLDGLKLDFQPTSVYCYTVGRNTVKFRKTSEFLAGMRQTP